VPDRARRHTSGCPTSAAARLSQNGFNRTEESKEEPCLMPGLTDTEFFIRADMLDTRVGQGHKADPAKVVAKVHWKLAEPKGQT
jgi:hypothetical protein